jgi:hypothetical protein
MLLLLLLEIAVDEGNTDIVITFEPVAAKIVFPAPGIPLQNKACCGSSIQ